MTKLIWPLLSLMVPFALMADGVNTSQTQFQNPPATTAGVSTSQSQYQNPKATDRAPIGAQGAGPIGAQSVSIPVQNNAAPLVSPADSQTIINSKKGGVIYQSNPLNDYSQPGTTTQTRSNQYTSPNSNTSTTTSTTTTTERSSYRGASTPDDEWHNTPNNENYFDDPNWPHVKKHTYRR